MNDLTKVATYLKQSGKEYAIWGIPKDDNSEVLLMGKYKDKPIVDFNLAKKLKEVLETKYDAKKVRIQTIDMNGEFDWMKDINLK